MTAFTSRNRMNLECYVAVNYILVLMLVMLNKPCVPSGNAFPVAMRLPATGDQQEMACAIPASDAIYSLPSDEVTSKSRNELALLPDKSSAGLDGIMFLEAVDSVSMALLSLLVESKNSSVSLWVTLYFAGFLFDEPIRRRLVSTALSRLFWGSPLL